MCRRYSRCESRCSRSYTSCSDSSEEREYSRHKRFDKFSNEREKYDTFISSRKRQYSSTSSDYSSSVEPMSKRTKTDQSSHNVNSPGVKLRLETDSPCQISLKLNSASFSQTDALKVLPKPDNKPKTQKRNGRKRQLRKRESNMKCTPERTKELKCAMIYLSMSLDTAESFEEMICLIIYSNINLDTAESLPEITRLIIYPGMSLVIADRIAEI
ncbi:hypothetical protein Bpfe_026167 [Biomphalaria pfeifferi]|uniref:Uncharacterized protein n=1 Tax=Biomphalaria pfeifferi TaxID=112525 RepID=A0AAD8EXR9_BIOPF|nr:hypothetical protein Bpfe_026167 [Biomphalaria pfeifferi]